MAAFLSVFSSLLVGVVLAVAPWTTLWETNYLVQPHPLVRSLLFNAFTRGAISGLGLVNLMLALIEAHDHVRDGGAEA
jgi:hypothetical protein